MELECVESLPAPTVSPTSTSSCTERPRKRSSMHHSPSCPHPNSFTSSEWTSPESLIRASSPLTQSPVPPSKRRRISRPSSPLIHPASTRGESVHPLRTLGNRDLKYVVKGCDHLHKTPVTPAMRQEVVAWCADIAAELQVSDAVAAITVNLFDRFLASRVIKRELLYALVAACLLIACKVVLDEEAPVEEICTRCRVSLEDVHLMEVVVLNVLKWEVNVATPHEVTQALNDDSELGQISGTSIALQESLMLNAMMEYSLAGVRASSIGVACYILSRSVEAGGDYCNPVDNPGYSMACSAGMSMDEVDVCLGKLQASLSSLIGVMERCDSDDDDSC